MKVLWKILNCCVALLCIANRLPAVSLAKETFCTSFFSCCRCYACSCCLLVPAKGQQSSGDTPRKETRCECLWEQVESFPCPRLQRMKLMTWFWKVDIQVKFSFLSDGHGCMLMARARISGKKWLHSGLQNLEDKILVHLSVVWKVVIDITSCQFWKSWKKPSGPGSALHMHLCVSSPQPNCPHPIPTNTHRGRK